MEIIYSKTGSSGNCTIIFDGESYLMIDCGIKLDEVNRGCGYILSRVKSCILTHSHADHSKYAKELMRKGVCVHSAYETAQDNNLSGKYSRCMCEMKTAKICSYMVVPFNLPHTNSDYTPCKNFGYLIYSTRTKERLLVCTDCHYIPQRFPPCEYYMIECNYMTREDSPEEFKYVNRVVESRRFKSHMSVECCKRFLTKQDLSKAKEVRLIHISKTGVDCSRDFKRIIEDAIQKEVIVE